MRTLPFVILYTIILITVGQAQQIDVISKTEINKLGLPIIQNYSPDTYGGHHQNFNITQSEEGLIYVANANGLLEYDGADWRLIRLPNFLPAFSVFADQNTIYVGGDGDFGYLEEDVRGTYQYHSLLEGVDSSYHDFRQVWHIKKLNNYIYFHSYAVLHQLAEDGSITSWQPLDPIFNLFRLSDDLYCQVSNTGIAKLEDNKYTWVDTSDHWKRIRVMDSESLNDTTVLCLTLNHGLLKYDKDGIHYLQTPADEFLKSNDFYNIAILDNGNIAIVGVEGLILLSPSGEDWIYKLNSDNGLIGDFGYSLFQDEQNGVWLATNVGLARVELSSPYTIFDDRNGLDGFVNTVHIHDDNVYVADHVGLARLENNFLQGPFNQFNRVTRPDMQGLHFLSLNDGVLASTRNGIKLINNEKIQLISELTSGCLYRSKIDSNIIYSGMFEGFSRLKFINNSWVVDKTFNVPNNDIRTIVEDSKGTLWMEPQNGGIYKVDLTQDSVEFKYFKSGIELPAAYAYLYEYQGEALIQSEKILYTYDNELDSLIRDDDLHDFFNNGNDVEPLLGFSDDNIIYETIDPEADGNILLSGNVTNGVLTLDTLDIDRISDRTLFRKVLKANDGIFWYAGRDGVARHDTKIKPNRNLQLQALIREVTVDRDSMIYGGHGTLQHGNLAYGSDLRIEYALPSYDNESDNLFQYYLEGYDKDWSSWTEETSKDYTRVSEGEYTFWVRGKNIYGQISKEGTIQFSIKPPWYRSWWMYIIYFMTAGVLFYAALQWRSRKLIKDRKLLRKIVEERTDELSAKNETLHNQKNQLEDKTKQLDQLIEFKSNFFTQITHDFRTPIAVINSMAVKIRDNHREVQAITRNSNSLLNLVDQVLDLNKLESNELIYHLEQVNIVEIIRQAFLNFKEYAHSQNKDFNLVEGVSQLYMDVDQKYLHRIITNLFSNALKFSNSKDKITVLVDQEDDQMKIVVSDTGVGIQPQDLDRIFTMYGRADNSQSLEGSGIGLPLVKGLVNQMGGSISVKSEYGQGTTFEVLLPISRNTTPADVNVFDVIVRPNTNSHLHDNFVIQNKADFTILIAEDNPDLLQVFKDHFEAQYTILMAQNGVDAWELAQKFMPDLVLSDVMMPKMDGLALCKKLKTNQMTSHIPIILLTAKADTDSIRKGLDAGANDYLSKPFDIDELDLRVQNLLAFKKLLQDKYCSALDISLANEVIDENEIQFLTDLNTIIEKHFPDENYTIRDLAKNLSTNHVSLNKKIKYLTGLTTATYIRKHKLKYAYQQLVSSNRKLLEISYSIGVNDPAYFTKMIRSEYGITPSEIRSSKQMR